MPFSDYLPWSGSNTLGEAFTTAQPGQSDALNQMQKDSYGQGLAQMMLNQGLAQSQQQALAQANSQRGGFGQANAAKNAAANSANMSSAAGMNAAMVRQRALESAMGGQLAQQKLGAQTQEFNQQAGQQQLGALMNAAGSSAGQGAGAGGGGAGGAGAGAGSVGSGAAMLAADADFVEPGGAAHWTLREEPTFLLALNRHTGQMGKVRVDPLSPEEHRQAMGAHGAGGLNSPDRMHTNVTDMDLPEGSLTQQGVSGFFPYPYSDRYYGTPSGAANDPSRAFPGTDIIPEDAGSVKDNGKGGDSNMLQNVGQGLGSSARPHMMNPMADMDLGGGRSTAYADGDFASQLRAIRDQASDASHPGPNLYEAERPDAYTRPLAPRTWGGEMTPPAPSAQKAPVRAVAPSVSGFGASSSPTALGPKLRAPLEPAQPESDVRWSPAVTADPGTILANSEEEAKEKARQLRSYYSSGSGAPPAPSTSPDMDLGGRSRYGDVDIVDDTDPANEQTKDNAAPSPYRREPTSRAETYDAWNYDPSMTYRSWPQRQKSTVGYPSEDTGPAGNTGDHPRSGEDPTKHYAPPERHNVPWHVDQPAPHRTHRGNLGVYADADLSAMRAAPLGQTNEQTKNVFGETKDTPNISGRLSAVWDRYLGRRLERIGDNSAAPSGPGAQRMSAVHDMDLGGRYDMDVLTRALAHGHATARKTQADHDRRLAALEQLVGMYG